MSRFVPRRLGVLLAAAALVPASLAVAAPAVAASTPVAHRVTVDPQVYRAGSLSPHVVSFGCQTRPLDGSQGPRCYQPAQIQTAYEVTPLLNAGKNGRGRTIVIVDAYGSPTIARDLQIFDTTFGLPAADFTQIAPAGAPPAFDPNDGNQVGWASRRPSTSSGPTRSRPARGSSWPSPRPTRTPTSSPRPST